MASSTRDMTESVWDAVALVDLPAKKYFKIGEVAALVGVEPHVLRYWQTQFRQVRPQKSRSGHRQYRRRDVETLLAIKELLHVQRFTIAGARQALKTVPSSLPRPADDRDDTPSVIPQRALAVAQARAPLTAQIAQAETADDDGADGVEFEVVGLDRDSQLRRARETEFAEQFHADVRVDVCVDSDDDDVTPTEHRVPLRVRPPADAVAEVTPSSNGVHSAHQGQLRNGVSDSRRVDPHVAQLHVAQQQHMVPTHVAAEHAPERSAIHGEHTGDVVVESHAPAGGVEFELETPRRRRLTTQQLGFGFVPTAREMLVAARREALEILDLLDREDAADRRHAAQK